MGIGIGPARLWLTQHAGDLIGKAKKHVTQNLTPVSAVSASASSSASGHPAALLIDGVSTTAWQSAAHAGGIGESVTITFANPVDIDNIEILDGLDADKYLTQARLRTASVTADGKAAGDISFNDKADLQGASVKLRGVTKVTLVITATYPGQQGQAVAIRELEFRVLQ